MLTCDDFIRFTDAEIEEAKKIGLDHSGVKTRTDFVQAEIDLINVLVEQRFDLLEKIVRGIAQIKGVKLPPKLTLVWPSV